MKNFLLGLIVILAMPISATTIDKIALVNMNVLFQEVAQKTGIKKKLENEFKSRARNLQIQETKIQKKLNLLQRKSSTISSNRKQLEKEIINQRNTFSQQAQQFEKDRARRSNEERSKLINRIQLAVKKVSYVYGIDLVIDTSTVAYKSSSVKEITDDVLKQVQ